MFHYYVWIVCGKRIGRWRLEYDVQKDRLVCFYFYKNEKRVNAVLMICLGKSGRRGGKDRTNFFGVEIMLLHNANTNSVYIGLNKKHALRCISMRPNWNEQPEQLYFLRTLTTLPSTEGRCTSKSTNFGPLIANNGPCDRSRTSTYCFLSASAGRRSNTIPSQTEIHRVIFLLDYHYVLVSIFIDKTELLLGFESRVSSYREKWKFLADNTQYLLKSYLMKKKPGSTYNIEKDSWYNTCTSKFGMMYKKHVIKCKKFFQPIQNINQSISEKKFQGSDRKYWNCKKNFVFSKSHLWLYN